MLFICCTTAGGKFRSRAEVGMGCKVGIGTAVVGTGALMLALTTAAPPTAVSNPIPTQQMTTRVRIDRRILCVMF
jgi:hypothetical protein